MAPTPIEWQGKVARLVARIHVRASPPGGIAVNRRRVMLRDLVELSRTLGAPQQDYAILAEGNTSARLGDESFLLKASGFSLGSAGPHSFVEMRTAAVLALLDSGPLDDEELTAALSACRVGKGPRPSVEAALHALALTLGGAAFVGHTHPAAVNAVLCSEHASALSDGMLFPDEVVVCGSHPLFVPWVDPGIALGVDLRARLRSHIDAHGEAPKLVYLQNHGIIALGRTASEVLQVTEMAAKTARIMLGALAAGGPHYLGDRDAARIETRPDEHYRQAMLGDPKRP